ncbi:hypothetical protein B0T16DRAFT_458617 [Cercophora newfieldiana]|uniref:Ecp2 effector protein domain-containing protein n=1 Tax=Cercophora newfieldiana TaxID=92897 RepID=A0AA40CQB1_9PEZI|nr:hypothetical protein B0T16DRAFT_458617 [Cercophora newfieldiana]
MKFTITPQLAVALVTLVGTAQSAPSTVPRSSPATVFHRELAKRDANCGDYSGWGDFPKDNAPLLEDCEKLRDTHSPETFVSVGEEDLFRMMRDLITMVGRFGHLRVEGQMFCKAADGATDVALDYKIDLPVDEDGL